VLLSRLCRSTGVDRAAPHHSVAGRRHHGYRQPLLCGFHHDRIDTGGWQITMRDGVPWFIPPAWIDPEQKPRRNVRP
jgi:hypothetical protein